MGQTERFDSCHSVWLLDVENRQFSRLPRGTKVEPGALKGPWEPYVDFEEHEDGSRLLVLNETRTRLLRFWEHTDPCPHCAGDRTEELRVATVEEGAD